MEYGHLTGMKSTFDNMEWKVEHIPVPQESIEQAKAAIEVEVGPGNWKIYPAGLDMPLSDQSICFRLWRDDSWTGYQVQWVAPRAEQE